MSPVLLGHLLYIGAMALVMAAIIAAGYLLRRFGRI